ncbi:hypothetical protein F5Y10DRAFT_272850 [Nemania abortiva]|nr:hypothetical protein F5Y10DRAFT_272850 [Nemania abortiva]
MQPHDKTPVIKTLRKVAPKAGMAYQSQYRIMHRESHDEIVVNALRDAGYQLSAKDFHRAFVPMFQIATPIFINARGTDDDLWDMLEKLEGELDWARAIPNTVFFELFTSLVEAHPLVVELVQPRKAVRDCPQEDGIERPDCDSWILTDAVIYNEIAGGFDDDEEEDEGMNEPDKCNGFIPPTEKMTMDPPEEQSDAMDLDN